MILIWFTQKPNPALMFEVQKGGHLCVQARTEALVRGVVAQYPESVVIVGADIPQAQAQEVQRRHTTIHLTRDATTRDILCELSNLFPPKATVQ